MKKFNLLIVIFIICYGFLSVGTWLLLINIDDGIDKKYQVEINRILNSKGVDNTSAKFDLSKYRYIKEVEYLPLKSQNDTVKIKAFYEGKRGYYSKFEPVISEHGILVGYARFDYLNDSSNNNIFIVVEVVLAVVFILIIVVLLYIRHAVIKPFNQISELPYELSKGHFKGELTESKNRYFGKFLWGLDLLRNTLNSHKNKELKLEKEKKLMLLTISHDIKTPLNSIKLYSKAIAENVYDTEEKKKEAARHICDKALEIENFVKEIIKASTEDVLEIEVKNSEFYLKNLMDKVKETYKSKCDLLMTEFTIGEYENKLIKGDMDRAIEVFENIIENAFKYGDGKSIHISLYEEDYCQLVRIHNTGKVIADNEFIHIFESFFRGSNTNGKEGNGLGLYICKKIMMKMDGDIFAEVDNNGMSFVIVLAQ